METELNKIKVVLLSLWDRQRNPETIKIIKQFRDEIEEIKRGD